MRIKRSFVIKVSIVFLVILMGYYVFTTFGRGENGSSEEHFPKLPAERYFSGLVIRKTVLQKLALTTFLDKDTGFVLNLYPLIKSPDATPIPQKQSRRMCKSRGQNETASISFYYRPIEEDEK